MDPVVFTISLITIGILPSLFWLWFWLREDKAKPEPIYLIASAFIAGAAVIPLVLALESVANFLFTDHYLILSWAVIEETLKYAAVLIVLICHKEIDEPIDCIIYLITIALGFATLENVLFIWHPLQAGELMGTILTGKFRFLGATLLHILASGTIGVFLALAFYKSVMVKLLFGLLGLFIAIVLHTLFNLLIIDADNSIVLAAFLLVWIGAIILFLTLELIKLKQKNNC